MVRKSSTCAPSWMNASKKRNPSGDGKVLTRRQTIGLVNDLEKEKGKPKITLKRKTRNPCKDTGWIRGFKNKYKECTDYLIKGKRQSGKNRNQNRESDPKNSCQSRSTSRRTHESPYSRKSYSPYSRGTESRRTHNSPYSRKSHSPYSRANESRRTHNSPYSRKSQSPYSRANESRRTSRDSRYTKNTSFGVKNWSNHVRLRGSRRSDWNFHKPVKTYSFWNGRNVRLNSTRNSKRRPREKEDDMYWGKGRQTWKSKSDKPNWDDDLNRKCGYNTKRKLMERDSPIKSNWEKDAIDSTWRSRSPLQRTRRDWRSARAKYRSPEKMKSYSFLDSKSHVIGRKKWTMNEWKSNCNPLSRKRGFSIWNMGNEIRNSPWTSKLSERTLVAEKSQKVDQTMFSKSAAMADENNPRKGSFGKSPNGREKSWIWTGIPKESRKFGQIQKNPRQNRKVTPTSAGKNTLKIRQRDSMQNHRNPKMSHLKEIGKQSREKNGKEMDPVKMKSTCTNKGVEPQKSPHTAYRIKRASEWIDTNCIPLAKSVWGDDDISKRRKKHSLKRNTDDDAIAKNKNCWGGPSEPLHIQRNTISNKFLAPPSKGILSKGKSKYSAYSKSVTAQKNSRKCPQTECGENARETDFLSNNKSKGNPKSSPTISQRLNFKDSVAAKHNSRRHLKSEHVVNSEKKEYPSKRISKWNTNSSTVRAKDMEEQRTDPYDEFRVRVPKLEPSSPDLLKSCWCRYCLGLTSKQPICCLYAFEENFNNGSQHVTRGSKRLSSSFVGKNPSSFRKTHGKENLEQRSILNKDESVVAFHRTQHVPNLWSRGDCAGTPQIPEPETRESEPKEIDLVVLNKESSEDECSQSDGKKAYAVANPFKLIELVNKRYGQMKKHLTLQIRKRKLKDGEPKTNLKLIWS